MPKLFTIQWSELWHALFPKKPTYTVAKNGWRCLRCKTDRYYVRTGDNAVLEPGCGDFSTEPVTACPLAPIDDDGNELTYGQWRTAK